MVKVISNTPSRQKQIFLFLRGRLENVHSEKERVRRELERAQHQ